MRLFKLTDKNNETRGHTKWGRGVTHTASGEGGLCGPGWIHAYTSPLLAVLLNPVHADFDEPRLWLARGVVGKNKLGLKVGTTRLTTIKRIRLPRITCCHRVRFAIFCSLQVYHNPEFVRWAENWLRGKDRSGATAKAAADAVRAGRATRGGRREWRRRRRNWRRRRHGSRRRTRYGGPGRRPWRRYGGGGGTDSEAPRSSISGPKSRKG